MRMLRPSIAVVTAVTFFVEAVGLAQESPADEDLQPPPNAPGQPIRASAPPSEPSPPAVPSTALPLAPPPAVPAALPADIVDPAPVGIARDTVLPSGDTAFMHLLADKRVV